MMRMATVNHPRFTSEYLDIIALAGIVDSALSVVEETSEDNVQESDDQFQSDEDDGGMPLAIVKAKVKVGRASVNASKPISGVAKNGKRKVVDLSDEK
jgi:hypothetical protein